MSGAGASRRGSGDTGGRKRKAATRKPLPDPGPFDFPQIRCLIDEFIIVLQDVAMLKKLREVMAAPSALSIPQQAFLQDVRVYVNEVWTGTFSASAMTQFKDFASKKTAYAHLPFPKARDSNKCMNDKTKAGMDSPAFALQAHQRDDILEHITVLFTMLSPSHRDDVQVKRVKAEGDVKQEDTGPGQASSSAAPVKHEARIKEENDDNDNGVLASLRPHVEEALGTVFRTSVSESDIEKEKKTLTANATHFDALADTEKHLQLIVLLRASIVLISNAILLRSSNDNQKSTYQAFFGMFFPQTVMQRQKFIPPAINRTIDNGGIRGLDKAFLAAAARDTGSWEAIQPNGDRLLDFLVKALSAVPRLQHPCEAVVKTEA